MVFRGFCVDGDGSWLGSSWGVGGLEFDWGKLSMGKGIWKLQLLGRKRES